MENPNIAPETKPKAEFENLQNVETTPDVRVQNAEQEKRVESETKPDMDARAEAELKQVGALSAAISATPSDDQGSEPVASIFIDIPGNSPEEKILHLLNDFPVEKSKEIVDGLEELGAH